MWQETVKKNFTHKVDKDQIKIKVCPYCNNDRFNFEVSSSKGVYHCWVCGVGGRVDKLFRDMGWEFDTTGWQPSIVPERPAVETVDLGNFSVVDYTPNRKFLYSRGIEPEDVIRYN